MPERTRTPWWLWPSLVSLDAPLVAMAWMFMFAEAWRVNYVPALAYFGLGAAVWAIYVVDRVMDLRLKGEGRPGIARRHDFPWRHRKVFGVGLMVALGLVVWTVFGVLPMEFLLSYALIGGILVAGTFFLITTGAGSGIPYGRNILAGLAFGFGTAMMVHLYVPTEGVIELLGSREMLSFGVLCVLNISAIHLWEHSRMSEDPEVKAADEIALTLPLTLLAAFALVFAYLDNRGMFGGGVASGEGQARPFFYAVLISAALLQVLNRHRSRFSLDALRALADATLLVPLPLFLVLAHG